MAAKEKCPTDAASRIVWAAFVEHNGLLGDLTVVRDPAADYGLPQSLYLDRHSIFFLTEEDALAAHRTTNTTPGASRHDRVKVTTCLP